MTWSLHLGRHFLEQSQEAWEILNTRCYCAHPLLDAKFIVPLYVCFGSDATMLMAREDKAGQVIGLALVEKAGVGAWRLFMPSQAVLKTTYDESMASLSSGRLIDYLMLARVFANPKIRHIENYTNASSADARWFSGTRLLYYVNFYPSGTLRHIADLRRWMRRLPVPRSAVIHQSILVVLWCAGA